MSGVRSVVALGVLVVLAGAVRATASAQPRAGVEVIVLLDAPATVGKAIDPGDTEAINAAVHPVQDRFIRTLDPDHGYVLGRLKYSPVLSVRVASADRIDAIRARPDVKMVTPHETGGVVSLESSVARIRADRLHDLDILGEGVNIAFLDSGIDADHPRLHGALLDEACFVSPGDDDDRSRPLCPNGSSMQQGEGSAADDNGHGTAVAGILASRGVERVNTGLIETGVAPAARLVALKVLDGDGRSESLLDVAAALEWLIDSGHAVDVVNLSVSSDTGYETVCDNSSPSNVAMASAVSVLNARGTVVVAASGNGRLGGTIRSPACLGGVLAVAALDADDRLALFSDGGPLVDLAAPGEGIVTTAPGGSIGSITGTSAAAPHVAGCVALLKSAVNGLSADTYREALAESAAAGAADVRNGLTYPILDCRASFDAIRFLEPEDDPGGPVEGGLVEVYPNPMYERGVIRVVVAEDALLDVEIFDVLGRRVYMRTVNVRAEVPAVLQLEGSGLASGLYLLRASGSSMSSVTTLVIE